MQKKVILIAVLFLAVGAAGFFYYTQRSEDLDVPDPVLAVIKARCEVYDQSPYQDLTIGLRVTFTSDQVICLSKDTMNDTYEVSLWAKSAFDSKRFDGSFEDMILGKISVHPRPNLPESNVVGQFSTVINGNPVDGDIIVSPSCKTPGCPQARRVLFQRLGERVSIEAYNEQFNFFEHIQFIDDVE